MDGPRLLGQVPWVLFKTRRTQGYGMNQVAVLHGQSGTLGSMPSHLGTGGHCLCTQSAVSTESPLQRLIPERGHLLSDGGSCQVPEELGYENQ